MKRLGDRLKKEPKDNIGGAVVDRYSCSKLMRYIKNLPVAPISYVRTKAPMCKKRSIQKYTPEGRAEIHENLGFMRITVYHSFVRNMESVRLLVKCLNLWEIFIATISYRRTGVAGITTKI